MNKIIDIEALSKMPITKEFAELLFNKKDINLSKITIEYPLKHSSYLRIGYKYDDYFFSENGDIDYQMTSQTEELRNAFQIVRYIDNYLNSLKG